MGIKTAPTAEHLATAIALVALDARMHKHMLLHVESMMKAATTVRAHVLLGFGMYFLVVHHIGPVGARNTALVTRQRPIEMIADVSSQIRQVVDEPLADVALIGARITTLRFRARFGFRCVFGGGLLGGRRGRILCSEWNDFDFDAFTTRILITIVDFRLLFQTPI